MKHTKRSSGSRSSSARDRTRRRPFCEKSWSDTTEQLKKKRSLRLKKSWKLRSSAWKTNLKWLSQNLNKSYQNCELFIFKFTTQTGGKTFVPLLGNTWKSFCTTSCTATWRTCSLHVRHAALQVCCQEDTMMLCSNGQSNVFSFATMSSKFERLTNNLESFNQQ